jgi:hypothetical protein
LLGTPGTNLVVGGISGHKFGAQIGAHRLVRRSPAGGPGGACGDGPAMPSGLDHPAITTVVRRSCSGASQDLCAALRTFGSRPARCTVSVAPRGTAIGAGQPTPAPIRPYVPGQTAAGVYRIWHPSVSFLKEWGRSRAAGSFVWAFRFLRRSMGERQRGVGVQDRPEADRGAAVGPGGPRRAGGSCSARRRGLGSSLFLLVCWRVDARVLQCRGCFGWVDRPGWGCRSFLRRVGGGMEWCDRVVRLGGVNQEDDLAMVGSQTTNDPRPASAGGQTQSGLRPAG